VCGIDPISTNIADDSTASKASPAGKACTVFAATGRLAPDQAKGVPQPSGKRSSVQLTIF
jgi:hypothetical protein